MRMNKIVHAISRLLLAIFISSNARAESGASTQSEAGPYHVSKTFHIGGEGAWDDLTVDPEHQLLYVPRSTDTMVLDARTGKTVADIPGQRRNHGVAIVPSAGRGFITDGNDASVTVFDLKTYAVLGKVKADADADGVIYDPASGKVLVVCGDPGLLLPITAELDLGTGSADQKVELGGKPEFLAADGKGKAYINLVDKDQVAGDICASCGDGTLTVVGEPTPGKFQVVQSVQTPRGARTTPLIASISPGTRLIVGAVSRLACGIETDSRRFNISWTGFSGNPDDGTIELRIALKQWRPWGT